jgi:hypothetical protein
MKNLPRLLLVLLVGSLAALAADPLMGTWKVIPESSQYPGGNGPANVVLKYEATAVAGEVTFTLNGEMRGKPYSYSWTAKADGKRYRPTGQTGAQEIEFQRPEPDHAIAIHYRDGQEIARHDAAISPDGQVMTTRSRSRNREGEIRESEARYRKQ